MDYKVYLQDGTEHTYSEEDLGKFIKEGTWPGYSPEQNPVINVQTNDGLISVPFTKQNVIEAVQNNFNLEDSGTATNRAWDEKVNEAGEFVNASKALLQGVEKVAFLGFSPISHSLDALTGEEYGDEIREARARTNPATSFIGEGIGLVGSTIATGGSGLAAKALSKGTAAGLSELGAKAAARGLGGGVLAETGARFSEAALVSAANELGEKYINDKELAGEEIAGNILWAGLLGGGTAGIMESAGKLIGYAGKGLKSKLDDKIGMYVDAYAAKEGLGEAEKKVLRETLLDPESYNLWKNQKGIKLEDAQHIANLDNSVQELSEEITRSVYKDPANFFGKNEFVTSNFNKYYTVLDEVWTKVHNDLISTGVFKGPMEGGIDDILKQAGPGFDDFGAAIRELDDKIITAKRARGQKVTADSIKNTSIREKIDLLMSDGPFTNAEKLDFMKRTFNDLAWMRRDLNSTLRKMYDKPADMASDSVELLYKSAIDNIDNLLEDSAFFGMAGKEFANIRKATAPYLEHMRVNRAAPKMQEQVDKVGAIPIKRTFSDNTLNLLNNWVDHPDRINEWVVRVGLRESTAKSIAAIGKKYGDDAISKLSKKFDDVTSKLNGAYSDTYDKLVKVKYLDDLFKSDKMGIFQMVGPFSLGWAITGSPVGGVLFSGALTLLENPKYIAQYMSMRRNVADTSAGKFYSKTMGLAKSLISGSVETVKGGYSLSKTLAGVHPAFENYDDIHEQVRKLTPEAVKQYLDNNFEAESVIDPQLRSALETKLIEMMRNLQKDLPQVKQQLMGKPLPSNKLKNRNINDKIAIASDVSKIVDIIQSGRVNKEVMDFFANNYPKHYQALVRQITDRMHEVKNTVANRRVVSLILGTPVTLSQENIQHLQKTYEQKGTPNQARPVARVSERAMEKDRQAHMTDTSRLSYGIKN